MVYRIHRGHLQLHRLPFLDSVGGILDVRDAELRHRHEALDVLAQVHHHTLVHQSEHAAPHLGADGIRLADAQPRVLLCLLQAQRDALVLGVHVQDQHLDLVALLHDLGRMLHALGPRHVGDVDQTVDAGLDLHERPERGEVAHLAFEPRPDRVLLRQRHPRIFLGLLHAEGDLLFGFVDLQHDGFYRFADRDDLGGVAHVAGPAHLGDVYEAFDSRLELDECAVVGDRHDLALHSRAHRILRGHVLPGVRLELLQAEADALPLPVDVEDFDFDLLADLHHLGRMRHAPVAHVGDVQQAVHAAEIDEGAEIGDVLHDPLPHLTDLQLLREDHRAFLVLQVLEEDLDLVAFLQGLGIFELVDWHRAFRLEPDVENDGGVGHTQHLGLDDLALLDVGERALVQLRHLGDFVRRVFLVEIGSDAEVRVLRGRFVGLGLGQVVRIYQHSGYTGSVVCLVACPGRRPGAKGTAKPTQGAVPAPAPRRDRPAARATDRGYRAAPRPPLPAGGPPDAWNRRGPALPGPAPPARARPDRSCSPAGPAGGAPAPPGSP